MGRIDNPFHELYVTEGINDQEFVELFSPQLVRPALALFRPGNVVLTGDPGSGKTMLLSLLKPEIRLAYARSGVKFPVPEEASVFIGAGINLTRSGATDFMQRPFLSDDGTPDALVGALSFGDFLNFWVVDDVLNSLEVLVDVCEYDARSPALAQLAANWSKRDEFARRVAAEDCWFGYLAGVDSMTELRARVRERINHYRNYLMFNVEQLDPSVATTKTSVGEPVSRVARLIHEVGLLPDTSPVLVRVDQMELLKDISSGSPELRVGIRGVVNKLLSLRDPHVSYKMGVRRYGWRDELRILGSETKLERDRDYALIDIDHVLRRKENLAWSLYRGFAKDVFRRRVEYAGFSIPSSDPLAYVLGASPTPEERARVYAGSRGKDIIKIEGDWSPRWVQLISDAAERSPLEGRLAEAYLRQKLAGSKQGKVSEPKPPYPWDERKYWRKERVQQALLQIAGRSGQRIRWWGEDDVLKLSGSSILAFVTLCQHIWSMWLMSETQGLESRVPGPIPATVQSVGILAASSDWYKKISESPGGELRHQFVGVLGHLFHRQLYSDDRMSYPGANGFSLSNADLESAPDVTRLVRECVDWGELYEVPHTTKYATKEERTKYYLHPVLSPHFRIPVEHVKEPLYVVPATVEKWIQAAASMRLGIAGADADEVTNNLGEQLTLLSDDENSEQQ